MSYFNHCKFTLLCLLGRQLMFIPLIIAQPLWLQQDLKFCIASDLYCYVYTLHGCQFILFPWYFIRFFFRLAEYLSYTIIKIILHFESEEIFTILIIYKISYQCRIIIQLAYKRENTKNGVKTIPRHENRPSQYNFYLIFFVAHQVISSIFLTICQFQQKRNLPPATTNSI